MRPLRTWPAPLRVTAALVGAAAAYAFAQLAASSLRLDRDAWPKNEARVIVPPPRTARLMVAGYNELAADMVWARALVYYGDGIATGSTIQDIDPLLELVNTLDPRFRRPYVWGAYATTFRRRIATQEEFRGSVAVLERGVAAFPEDWELHWILGLRYYADLKSDDPAEQRRYKETGAAYIERAMRLPGAPADLPGLAASLRTELGQKDRALRELREMILTTEDEKARAKLLARYRALAEEGMADALARARQEFDNAWKAELPYAPPSLFVLIGPAAPERSAEELLGGPLWQEEPAEADGEGSGPQAGADE